MLGKIDNSFSYAVTILRTYALYYVSRKERKNSPQTPQETIETREGFYVGQKKQIPSGKGSIAPRMVFSVCRQAEKERAVPQIVASPNRSGSKTKRHFVQQIHQRTEKGSD